MAGASLQHLQPQAMAGGFHDVDTLSLYLGILQNVMSQENVLAVL